MGPGSGDCTSRRWPAGEPVGKCPRCLSPMQSGESFGRETQMCSLTPHNCAERYIFRLERLVAEKDESITLYASDAARLKCENTSIRSAADATQSLLDAILGACGDAHTVEEAVRWIGRELEEKLALRTERDEARRIAVELGKCRMCGGDGQCVEWATMDPLSVTKTVRCENCSGTGLDARVPKEWAT